MSKGYDMFGNNPKDLGACLGRGYCLGTVLLAIVFIVAWVAHGLGFLH